ncbi:hypothetical protein SERLA73DRAFT_135355 [Serpula lacrymans var. lacrymans S7.3]|uniref:Uncharacterized protein n=2 Tax=Serpula lacrymans var. lacrymans TaxID=341189 RepID=F8PW18_SERL3|nr:uncharacterized protein SERLADRAFT_368847 [Serpula lacrymans var. lacrymans S7.9]EGN99877.1 hypothetical protein SERLA73DRAFT_135355 [Serpula lacrymans var. lacrymans S7.3]EGO25446.1 hypothetical protein SERLADRAFT_368847 [Serpula lacrymans var. lacrymans S7.9]
MEDMHTYAYLPFGPDIITVSHQYHTTISQDLQSPQLPTMVAIIWIPISVVIVFQL